MATFTVNLSPALVNLGSEGGLDSSLDANGNSLQRKLHAVMVDSGEKIVGNLADGATFDDSTDGLASIDGIDAA
jgi:hypothetical protein